MTHRKYLVSKKDELYGRGVAEIEGTVEAEEIRRTLRHTFARPDYQPPMLPSVVLELTQLSYRPEVSFAEVEALLARDPALCGQLIRAASRGRYLGQPELRSLRQALMRLGLTRLRNEVLRLSLSGRVFRAVGWNQEVEKVVRHSEFVAQWAEVVARVAGTDPGFAYLMGLLHDVGILAALVALGDQRKGRRPDLQLAWPAILEEHELAGARVLRVWGLPDDLVAAVASHHSLPGGGVGRHSAVLALAEALARRAGQQLEAGGCAEKRTDKATLARAARQLGIRGKLAEVIELGSEMGLAA